MLTLTQDRPLFVIVPSRVAHRGKESRLFRTLSRLGFVFAQYITMLRHRFRLGQTGIGPVDNKDS